MDTRSLKIHRPCPVELDVDRSGRQFYCRHCDKDVHVLANWPRAEAEAFIAANRGSSVCVSLRRDAQGELVYADSPPPAPVLVPAARLRRRWLPEAAAAAGVAAALAACTPHGRAPGIEHGDDEALARAPALEVVVPDESPCEKPESVTVEEGRLHPPPQVIERGELPATPPPAKVKPNPTKRAPGAREKPADPEPHKYDILDGGIDM